MTLISASNNVKREQLLCTWLLKYAIYDINKYDCIKYWNLFIANCWWSLHHALMVIRGESCRAFPIGGLLFTISCWIKSIAYNITCRNHVSCANTVCIKSEMCLHQSQEGFIGHWSRTGKTFKPLTIKCQGKEYIENNPEIGESKWYLLSRQWRQH